MSPRIKWVPPDGGYAWVVLACSTILHAQTSGLILSMSVMYVSWLDTFQDGRGVTSWIISIAIAVEYGFGPIAAALANAYGFRAVVFTGGLLAAAGYILSYFATSVVHLVITIGLITGTGSSFCYLSGVATVNLYFDKRRPLAIGIATAGVGVGVLVIAPMLNHLIQVYGWRGACLITGAFALNMCVCGVLLRPQYTTEVCEETECDVVNIDDVNYNLREEKSVMDEVEHSGGNLVDENMDATLLQISPALDKCLNPKNLLLENVRMNGDMPLTHSIETLAGFQTVNAERHQHDKLKARSMLRLEVIKMNGNTTRLFSSLRELNMNQRIHNINDRVVRLLKHSTEVIAARSLKHLDVITLLGTLPNDALQNGNLLRNDLSSSFVEVRDNASQCSGNENQTSDSASFITRLKAVFSRNAALLQDPLFFQFALSNVATNLSYITPVMFLVDRALDSGMDRSTGAMLVALNGAGNIVGRLLFGAFTNRFRGDRLMTYIVTLVLAGVLTMLSALCGSSEVLHCIYAFLIGALLGGYCMLVAVATADIMGLEKAADSFGLLLAFMGVATLLGPPFAGTLFDWTDSYTLTYIIFGGFLVCSGIILLPAACIRRREMNRKEKDGADDVSNHSSNNSI